MSRRVLLASCEGSPDALGGIFAVEDDGVTRIDPLPSAGLTHSEGRLIRAIRIIRQGGELLVYDRVGIERYMRLDDLRDCHDVLFHNGKLLVVCSGHNAIAVIGAGGDIAELWRAPTGTGDAWHLNGLTEHDGRLVVSAFGRFESHRGWKGRLHDGCGIVFDWGSGQELVSGLNAPHTPRYVDGAWVVCDSQTSDLVRADPDTGAIVDRLRLEGFTRGIAVDEDVLYVGESPVRITPASRRPVGLPGLRRASIAVVDRRDWTVSDRIVLDDPGQIYDLLLVPPELRDAVATGFRTNPPRAQAQQQESMFLEAGVRPVRLWAIGLTLPRAACHVEIEADPPKSARAGEEVAVPISFTNRGGAVLISHPPHPVSLSYRWFDAGGRLVEEGPRMMLPRPAPPGERFRVTMPVVPPPAPGRYELRITLVQELVRWFDDVAPENGWRGWIDIIGPRRGRPPVLRTSVMRNRRLRRLATRLLRLREAWREEPHPDWWGRP